MCAAYFDIQRLLEGAENVPVAMRSQVELLGPLDPRQDTSLLPKGAEFNAPLWLTEAVAKAKLFTVNVPDCLGEKQVTTMEVEPRSFKPEMKYSLNYFNTLYRMCQVFGAKHEASRDRVKKALRSAAKQRLQGQNKDNKNLCVAERLLVKSRQEMQELFACFQVCLLQ
ncbi:Conserved_hypothetical protein [Hexamita inflata]|uniref:DNA replication complex GINS protein PSF3 n=1 Tax=Hexamita inflata TaxID=28002 RepID=A0ABP1GZ19_9EUKA